MINPDLTVIICSYNRADSLREALNSLTSLETDGFTYEVLVVDNASKDHTPEVVQEVAASSDCQIRYVMESQPGVSFARNRGVHEALGQWLVFFDDDQLAGPEWLIQLLEAARDNDVKCVGGGMRVCFIDKDGAAIPDPHDLKPWVRVMFSCTREITEGRFYDRTLTPGAGNMLIHREVFDKIGLFRTDLVEGGEDTDLFHRMSEAGFKAFHTPKAVIIHRVPEFRLEPKFMKPASMRMGSHVARREYRDFSRPTYFLVTLARTAQVFLWHGVRLLVAQAGGDEALILERQCRWWLGQGYLQAAIQFLLRNDKAVSSLDFRSERKPAGS